MVYSFIKPLGYVSIGSTIEIPKKWIAGGIGVNAVVNLVGTNMKLFFTEAYVNRLIKDGYLDKQQNVI